MESQVRLLLVDESPAFLSELKSMVEPGFLVHSVETAAQAMDMAERVAVSVVFLDIALPDGEGYDVCAQLKKLYSMRPLQIVLMSSSVGDKQLEKIMVAGADDFITKPFETLEFQLRLKAATIRLAAQERLVAERDFYRRAVHQEEALSSKLLDRQMNLKEALAVATEKKKVLETEDKKLAAGARLDVLSGLLSRQSLASRIELEVRKTSELDVTLSGLMIDLDRFKSVNDTWGNLAGDEAIRTTGDAIHTCLRTEDYAGRYGGEEFFVLLPGATLDVALTVAERIRSFIEMTSVKREGKTFSVTVSIGAAELRKSESPGEWVARVDLAMYRAKQLGRNRVEA
ncbi:MAG: diguanylate cyclase [Spirochaetales bacterium]|nr:MAG: diguanylate cyclase [Spirochaetales bacterium]